MIGSDKDVEQYAVRSILRLWRTEVQHNGREGYRYDETYCVFDEMKNSDKNGRADLQY